MTLDESILSGNGPERLRRLLIVWRWGTGLEVPHLIHPDLHARERSLDVQF